MSFKSSLEALFKLSGGQAMPSNSFVTQSDSDESTRHFVAPFDGIFSCGTQGDMGLVEHIELTNDSANVSIKTCSIATRYAGAFVPCKKGDSITANFIGRSEGINLVCKFIKTVGSS